uniref:Uncharacterized protein n=1 Tax=Cacopsylla melanoneura TaxID=428564 RepID=A0A8D9F121_9HEMI
MFLPFGLVSVSSELFSLFAHFSHSLQNGRSICLSPIIPHEFRLYLPFGLISVPMSPCSVVHHFCSSSILVLQHPRPSCIRFDCFVLTVLFSLLPSYLHYFALVLFH